MPLVTYFALGGTIASIREPSQSGAAPALSANELLRSISMPDGVEVEVVQIPDRLHGHSALSLRDSNIHIGAGVVLCAFDQREYCCQLTSVTKPANGQAKKRRPIVTAQPG